MAKRVITIAVVAVMALLAVPVALAATAGDSPTPAPGAEGAQFPPLETGGCGRDIRAQLGLTADQAGQLKALREQFGADTKELREQLRTLRQELGGLLRSVEATRAQIDAKFQALDQVQTALRDKMLTNRDALKAILTPEQFAKLADLECFGRGGFGRRGPRGGGN
jgi:Spy/CpxP family protein refolding chaperone